MGGSDAKSSESSTTTTTTNNTSDSYNKTFNAVNNISNSGNISLPSVPDALASLTTQPSSDYFYPMLLAGIAFLIIVVFKIFK